MRMHVWLGALALSLALGATAFGQSNGVNYSPFAAPSNGVNFNPFAKPSNAVTYYPFGGPNATATPQQPQSNLGANFKLRDLFPTFRPLSNSHVVGVSTYPDPQTDPTGYLQQFGYAKLR
jgi:hypothetical protein